MPLIAAGFAQANFIFRGDGCPTGAEITLGLAVDAYTGTVADAASDLRNNFQTNVLSVLPSGVTLDSVLCKFGPTATGPSASAASGSVGGGAGAQVSPAVCYLVHKNTSAGGRAGRGRFYLPGVSEGSVDESGTIAGATITALDAALADFYTQLGVDDLNPRVLHGAGSPLSAPTIINSFTVDSTAATQRRRQRR